MLESFHFAMLVEYQEGTHYCCLAIHKMFCEEDLGVLVKISRLLYLYNQFWYILFPTPSQPCMKKIPNPTRILIIYPNPSHTRFHLSSLSIIFFFRGPTNSNCKTQKPAVKPCLLVVVINWCETKHIGLSTPEVPACDLSKTYGVPNRPSSTRRA